MDTPGEMWRTERDESQHQGPYLFASMSPTWRYSVAVSAQTDKRGGVLMLVLHPAEMSIKNPV